MSVADAMLKGLAEIGIEDEKRQRKLEQEASLGLKDDGSNIATVFGYPYGFEATGDRILIAVDIFKSDYDCKECNGTGDIVGMCYCENTDRPGFAYSSVSESEPSFNIKCKQCKGDYQNYRSKEPCPACNGKGALLFLGKEDKILPTTGIIMSKGNGVAEPKYTIGVRVVFGKFSGTAIPTKATGVMFKFLREHEILGIIHNGEPVGSFNFVTPEGGE